jgi:hypothetical protein
VDSGGSKVVERKQVAGITVDARKRVEAQRLKTSVNVSARTGSQSTLIKEDQVRTRIAARG